MSNSDLAYAITDNVKLALNGDKEACKKLNLLIQIPFSSIENLYGTSEEDHYSLNVIASLRLKMFNDKSALQFLTSPKNPLREIFSSVVGLLKL